MTDPPSPSIGEIVRVSDPQTRGAESCEIANAQGDGGEGATFAVVTDPPSPSFGEIVRVSDPSGDGGS